MKERSRKICDYIRYYLNTGFEVNPDQYLTSDLGIDVDQGVYFIEDFQNEFNVDFSTMTITKHFACGNAFTTLLEALRNMLGGKVPFKVDLIDLRVSDLIIAVERGEWSDSFIK